MIMNQFVCSVLYDRLGLKHVITRLHPKDLNLLQKLNRIKVAGDILERVNFDSTFIKWIITGDDT